MAHHNRDISDADDRFPDGIKEQIFTGWFDTEQHDAVTFCHSLVFNCYTEETAFFRRRESIDFDIEFFRLASQIKPVDCVRS